MKSGKILYAKKKCESSNGNEPCELECGSSAWSNYTPKQLLV